MRRNWEIQLFAFWAPQSAALIIPPQKVQMDLTLRSSVNFPSSHLVFSNCNFPFYFKSDLTQIYGNVRFLFIRWRMILQRRRLREGFCVKGWKSSAGGRAVPLCGVCRRVLVDAAVGGAWRPQGGCRSRGGGAPTQQGVQEVIGGASLRTQGLLGKRERIHHLFILIR